MVSGMESLCHVLVGFHLLLSTLRTMNRRYIVCLWSKEYCSAAYLSIPLKIMNYILYDSQLSIIFFRTRRNISVEIQAMQSAYKPLPSIIDMVPSFTIVSTVDPIICITKLSPHL